VTRLHSAFGAIVLGQAVHSIEEYVSRLWESFPPARFLTGLISEDLEQGFILINVALVAFGVWCFFWPVRRAWSSARGFVWFWIVIGMVNGVGHPLWSLRQGGYTPGVGTALVLLVLALNLVRELRRDVASSAVR